MAKHKKHHRPHTPVPAIDAEGHATSYGLRGKPPESEMPIFDAEHDVDWLQDLLIKAGKSLAHGADNKYGWETHGAALMVAAEAGVKLSEVKFKDMNDPKTKKFMNALKVHEKAHDEVKQELVTGQAPDVDAARRAAEAEAARRRAAEEALIPESIRGTPYDPRVLNTLTREGRRQLMVQGLFAVDELKDNDLSRNHDHDKIHDKMAETIRRVNKQLGREAYPKLREFDDPLSNAALMALGERVALKAGIRNRDVSIYDNAQTQEQMNAAAATGLRALDRTSSGRVDQLDPDSMARLKHNIRKFERDVMGLSKQEADGIADPQMLAALEQALRARGELAQVTGGTTTLQPSGPAGTPEGRRDRGAPLPPK